MTAFDEAFALVLARVEQRSRRDKEMLILRVGLGGSPPRTLESIAMDYGVTRERVRQIVRRALVRIRPVNHRHPLFPFREPTSQIETDTWDPDAMQIMMQFARDLNRRARLPTGDDASPPKGRASVRRSYRVAAVRHQYPRAYMSWSDEEDEIMRAMNEAGHAAWEIAARLKRQPSAVVIRLNQTVRDDDRAREVH